MTKKLRQLRKSEQLELQMLRGSGCPPELRGDLVLDVDHFATGREQYIVNWWPGAHLKAFQARSQQLAEQEQEVKRLAARLAMSFLLAFCLLSKRFGMLWS